NGTPDSAGNYAGAQIGDFLAYPSFFTGGAYVAVGDVNGDGYNDIVTAPGPGTMSSLIEAVPEGQAGAGSGDDGGRRSRHFQSGSAQGDSHGRNQKDRGHTSEHYVQPALKLPLFAPFEHSKTECRISCRRGGMTKNFHDP